ncbi:MAG: glycosyltransferase family 2 protein [Treponema sp.]|nr:glycosyltransferase family 2 protein [Treponema sp.]
MKQGILIPVYKHGETVCPLAEKLAVLELPIIIVDDGNNSETKAYLNNFAAKKQEIILVSLKKNLGKGGAFIQGLKKAAELGLTHVLQIDADGQHDYARAAFFLEESDRHPDKVICGYPEFDESAPKGRVTGRKISTFWAVVTTLSLELKDVMCGFRVYPVEPSLRITKVPFFNRRMGFDAEILVRLYWKKVFPVFHPVKVTYPPDGISNFRIVRDNITISWTFCRLFIGMLPRMIPLIACNIKRRKAKL